MERIWLVSFVLMTTVACWGQRNRRNETEPIREPEEEPQHTYELDPLPVTGWDPVYVREDGTVTYPIVEDTLGNTMGMSSTTPDYGHPIVTYVASPMLEPGDYFIRGSSSMPDQLSEPFTVGSWGQNPLFQPADVEGKVFYLDETPWFAAPEQVGDLVETLLQDYYIEFLAIEENNADFRVIAQGGPDEIDPCVVLEDTATLSSEGLFTWSMDEIVADAEPDPFVMKQPSIRFGLDQAGEEGKGVEMNTWLDLRVLGFLVSDEPDANEDEICALLSAFDVDCYDCLEDGRDSCTYISTHGGSLNSSDELFDEDLPYCVGDLTDVGVDFDFDWDCGCNSGRGAELGLFALMMLMLRRRQQKSNDKLED
jgi:hypothetical protein